MQAGAANDTELVSSLAGHMGQAIAAAPLVREPFCHIYTPSFLPPDLYPALLRNLPDPSLYAPINLRKWVRADGTSTRDQCYLTPETIARMPREAAVLWSSLVKAAMSEGFRRTVFSKL